MSQHEKICRFFLSLQDGLDKANKKKTISRYCPFKLSLLVLTEVKLPELVKCLSLPLAAEEDHGVEELDR